jgi:acetyl esterase
MQNMRKIGIVAATLALAAAMQMHAHAAPANAPAAPETDQTPFIKPDVQAYLDALKAKPQRRLDRQMLTMIRSIPPERMVSTDDLPVGDIAVVKDVTMPSDTGPIRMRLYDARADRGPSPVVIFYHGGAYVVGSIETHAGLTAEISRQLDLPVVSVDYRLAPENPWPAGVDDGEAAARWIADNGKAFGREFTGLILSGDSAGGNLTLVTALALRDKAASLPLLAQIPIYPSADTSRPYPSAAQFNQGYALDRSPDDENFYKADPKSPRASPLLADLTGLPPTILVTASLDPLRDEGRAFAAKLIEAGVTLTYYEAKGTIHGFATYRKSIPSAQRDTQDFLSLTKAMLDRIAADPK